MAGLLGDIYSAADSAKRRVYGLLGDPVGTAKQFVGMLADDARNNTNISNAAWDSRDTNKLAQAMLDTTRSAVSFAPIGMTSSNKLAGLLRDNAPMKTEIPDMINLYHGSHEKLNEINNGGLFGGVFASEEKGAAKSHGPNLHKIYLPDGSIASSSDIDTELVELYLKSRLRPFSDEEYGDIYKGVVRGKGLWNSEIPESRLLDIFKSSEMSEADWFAQRLRGELAQQHGFKAIEMPDEHGISYLVLPGSKIAPVE